AEGPERLLHVVERRVLVEPEPHRATDLREVGEVLERDERRAPLGCLPRHVPAEAIEVSAREPGERGADAAAAKAPLPGGDELGRRHPRGALAGRRTPGSARREPEE